MPIDNAGIACEPRTRCIVCGAPGEVLHEGLRDQLFGAPGVWSTRRCTGPACGLGWLDPQPRADQLGRLYESYWTHGTGEAGVYRTRGGRRLAKAALARLVPWRRAAFESDLLHLQGMNPGRVLDVGCGSGDFLAALAAGGWRATGIDFDPDAVAAARRRPGVEAHVGDLAERRFEAAAFDAVVLNNVIEHLADPVGALAECVRLLRPGGRLVMVTPNLDALGHRLYGPDWRGLEPPRHLNLFTARVLKRLAREAGLRKAEIATSTGQTSPDWPMLAVSAEIAARAGRTPPAVDRRRLEWREKLLDLAGVPCGEWVTLVATR